MQTFLLVFHIILSFVIVVVILLQSGKGGGLGAGFGGAAAVGQEIFGGRGAATFLGKLTVFLGAAFMTTSIALAWFSSKPQSVLDLTQGGGAASSAQVHQILEEGSGPMPGAMEELTIPAQPTPTPMDPSEIPPEVMEQLQQQLNELDGDDPLELPEIPAQPGTEDAVPAPTPTPPVPSPPPETQPEVEEETEADPPAVEEPIAPPLEEPSGQPVEEVEVE